MPITLKVDNAQAKPLLKVATYTVATLPTAADHPNTIILITNGNAGLGTLAISDGTSWWPITVGTTAAAAS